MQQQIADILKNDVFSSVRTRHLFSITLQLPPLLEVGQTPNGHRYLGLIAGGEVVGERLNGSVISGNDWIVVRPDGSAKLDVRLAFRTVGGSLVTMTYRGLRHGPQQVIERIGRDEPVDPACYYFRIAPFFETADPALAWLNGVVAIGIGHRLSGVPLYNVFEIL